MDLFCNQTYQNSRGESHELAFFIMLDKLLWLGDEKWGQRKPINFTYVEPHS